MFEYNSAKSSWSGCARECQNQPVSGATYCQNCLIVWQRAFQLREEEAWQALYKLYVPRAEVEIKRAIIISNATNLDFDVEVLVHEVFLRLYRNHNLQNFDQKFQYIGQVIKMFLLTCGAVVIDEIRRQTTASRKSPPNPVIVDSNFDEIAQLPDNSSGPVELLENLEFARQVRQRLMQLLPAEERLLLYAKRAWGLSNSEIKTTYPKDFPDDKMIGRIEKRLERRLDSLREDPILMFLFRQI